MARFASKTAPIPFQYIRDFQSQFKVPTQNELPDLPSFTGGLVGYLGYDAVRYIEPKLKKRSHG